MTVFQDPITHTQVVWDTKKAYEQMFILPTEVMDAMDPADVNKTYEDMADIGIAKPPYGEFGIKTRIRYKTGKLAEALFLYKYAGEHKPNGDPKIQVAVIYYRELPHGENLVGDINSLAPELLKIFTRMAHILGVYLIVLLATRNIEKIKTVANLPKSISKTSKQTVTTIRIGKITEYEYERGLSISTGRVIRAHFRRGHIRNQHYGPHREYDKKIWIEPVFVNSDKEYVPRTAYNVTDHHELSAR